MRFFLEIFKPPLYFFAYDQRRISALSYYISPYISLIMGRPTVIALCYPVLYPAPFRKIRHLCPILVGISIAAMSAAGTTKGLLPRRVIYMGATR